ncbi:MAG: hypothetical protein KF690_00600 [Bacteroidetes bacterium]|nr:hypothetical protein [Bacteroidota bacterium]
MQLSDESIRSYTIPLKGGNLPADTLPAILDASGIIILHFLRHLGCLYCKAQVDKLYRLEQQTPGFPPIIFVHQSDARSADAFFAKHFPGAIHIADPKFELYKLFGIRKLGGLHLVNPLMVLKGIALTFRGYTNRIGQGNIRLLSGTFLFFKGRLRWSHRARYAGEEPRWAEVLGKKA